MGTSGQKRVMHGSAEGLGGNLLTTQKVGQARLFE